MLHQVPRGHRVQLRNQRAGVVGVALASLLEQGRVVREGIEAEFPVRALAQAIVGAQELVGEAAPERGVSGAGAEIRGALEFSGDVGVCQSGRGGAERRRCGQARSSEALGARGVGVALGGGG